MQYSLEKRVSKCYSGPMADEMDSLRQRIERLMQERGRSARSLSLAIGQNPAYIQQLVSGMRNKKAPSIEIMEAIARELDVPLAALRGTQPVAVAEVPAPYRVVPRRLTEADLFERFGIRPYDQPRSVEGVVASAGPGAAVPQGIDEATPRRVRGSKYLWEVPILGNCMADEIVSGDVVLYNPRLNPEIGGIMVALRDEEELIIKRLKLAGDKQVLRPNHGKDVPVDERIRFLGRGVSVQRPLL
jgi:phage repressor protein C with HTH and peptisase S24 domain